VAGVGVVVEAFEAGRGGVADVQLEIFLSHHVSMTRLDGDGRARKREANMRQLRNGSAELYSPLRGPHK
jgi:hypothetical protein